MARPVFTVRAAATSSDLIGIREIDPSYSTERIYRVSRGDLGFWLHEEHVSPPVHKAYSRAEPQLSDHLLVARTETAIVGYAELRFDRWSKRMEIEHIIVDEGYRGRGVGRSLMDALDQRARREPAARCLWLETQNTNFAAVQFYRRMGFRLCGLDETLYPPELPGLVLGEVALYFTRDLV